MSIVAVQTTRAIITSGNSGRGTGGSLAKETETAQKKAKTKSKLADRGEKVRDKQKVRK